jgi:RimJ/RimL family protein N-acetyltransferase
MPQHVFNEWGQEIGFAVPNWVAPAWPTRDVLQGRFCRLEPLTPAHAPNLFEAIAHESTDERWTYLPYGPYPNYAAYLAWVEQVSAKQDPLFFAIVDEQTGKAVGVASYLRITPASGTIEVGHLNFSPMLARTPAATEAMYLMMKHAFELGYRRYEWKCNALNLPSCEAAKRLGFTFEGIFRHALVAKGHNRDTTWFSIIDTEWPLIRAVIEQWLSPSNFDETGQQRLSLNSIFAKSLS